MTIRIPRKNILIDPDNPIDLSEMSDADAVDVIRQNYAFLGVIEDVVVMEDVIYIHLPVGDPFAGNRAQRQLQKAQRAAERGNYSAAVANYDKVLQVLPEDTTARRDLAMALMEVGERGKARQQLLHVLQLDPEGGKNIICAR